MRLISSTTHPSTTLNTLLTTAKIPFGTWENTLFATANTYTTLLQDANLQTAVLETVSTPLQTLKQTFGYVTEDIIGLTPQTPNLANILQKFRAEHHHTDDEVRVILHGEGIFGIVTPTGETFEVSLTQGDWIVIPAYTRHYFYLGEAQTVIALRVFKDTAGWEAVYEPLTATTV
jgi:1,2-dihydroxy-3-keto-5-methylthiopentene dioxygenase